MDVFVCRTQRPKYMKHTKVCDWSRYTIVCGFPGGSDSKASACNVGDLGSTPGSGRSTGEGIGYPLQFSSAFLVAQTVGNLPVKWKTWV